MMLEEVEKGLHLVREGKLEGLGGLKLADYPVVAACRLAAEEPDTTLVRGVLVKGLLHWAVDRLHPNPGSCVDEAWVNPYDVRWLDQEWRPYHVLYHNHFEKRSFTKVAEQMGVSTSTLFNVRRSALAEAAEAVEMLRGDAQPAALAEYQRYANRARWTSLDPDVRSLLLRAVCYRYPLSPDLLAGWLGDGVIPHEWLPTLQARGLVQGSLSDGTLQIPSVFRAYLLSLRESPEAWLALPRWAVEDKARKDKSQWAQEWDRVKHRARAVQRREHERAVSYHLGRGAILEAAYNLYHLERMRDELSRGERAATLLIKHQEAVVGRYPWYEIAEVVGLFKDAPLSHSHWFQLKLLEGDATFAAAKVQQALEAYETVFDACHSPKEIRAVAAHRLGKAYRRFAPEAAQVYYEECASLLRQIATPSPLLVPVFVDRAWSFIQERRDLTEAERLLSLAQEFIEQQGTDKALEAKLHNAWAGIYVHREQPDKVIEHRWQAYIAAQKAQDRDFETKIAKNLGFDYAQLQKRYDVAFHFLKRALTLTIQAGERQLEGLCLKDIGNCCFWQEDYPKAIAYYEAAYAIFEEGNNTSWLTAVCLDLAEAYAEAHDGAKAHFYFRQGRVLAKQLEHSDYLAFVSYLLRKYPVLHALDMNLPPRLQWAVDYVARHGSITSRIYRTECPRSGGSPKTANRDINVQRTERPKSGCSAKTANRDINDLCQRGLLIAEGKARATKYRFAPPPA